MEWSDIAKILFGAGLGFVVAIAQTWLGDVRRKKRVIKLLSIQVPLVLGAFERYLGGNAIPDTELPNLRFIGAAELLALPSHLARSIYCLQEILDRAEMSRKIAWELRQNKQAPEFIAHSRVLWGSIPVVISQLRKIEKDL